MHKCSSLLRVGGTCMVGLVCLLASVGCSSMAVVIRSEPTVSPKLSNVRRLAVLGLRSNSQLVSADHLVSILTGQIIELNYYQVVERAQMDRLLQEHGFQLSAMVDENTAVRVGRILAVDAVIYGEISSARVRTERGVKNVAKALPNGQMIHEPQQTAVKRGVASVELRLVKVETAEIVASLSKSDEIVEPPFGEAIGEADIGGLGTDESIAREIIENLCGEFVDKITPYVSSGTRYVHKGDGDAMARAYLFASKGLWDKATAAWLKEAKADPNNAAACNDLGVAYERGGSRQEAGVWYDKAITLDPEESDYMRNFTEFRGGLKPQRVKREKNISGRRFMAGLRNVIRLGSDMYQTQRQRQSLPSVGSSMSVPTVPSATFNYQCLGCGNTFSGPVPNSMTQCPSCGLYLRTGRCSCGQVFAAPATARSVACPRCRQVVR